jgi:hypothetical protein
MGKRLLSAGHIVQINNTRLPKKILKGKFHKRPVGKSWLQWEDNIRRDTLLLLNILHEHGGCQKRTGTSGGELLKRPGPDVD